MFNRSCLKETFTVSLIALSIFTLGCSNQIKGEVSTAMFKHWIHSYEEDSKDIKAYRPDEYNFPPSRGREGFEFKKNGQFIRYAIGATDRREVIIGRWEAVGEDKIQIFFDNPKRSFTLDIVSSDENLLKIRR